MPQIKHVGVVRWFDAAKGYGFLTRQDGLKVFVHFSAIAGDGYKSLEGGQDVQFDIEQREKGPSALNVEVV